MPPTGVRAGRALEGFAVAVHADGPGPWSPAPASALPSAHAASKLWTGVIYGQGRRQASGKGLGWDWGDDGAIHFDKARFAGTPFDAAQGRLAIQMHRQRQCCRWRASVSRAAITP